MLTPSRYHRADGEPVPSITELLGEYLPQDDSGWIGHCIALEKDPDEYLGVLASIGTLAHHGVECWARGQALPVDGNVWCAIDWAGESREECLAIAQGCADRLIAWCEKNVTEVLAVERRMVGELCGGTIDMVARLTDGLVYVIDWKTSSSIQQKHRIQVEGYRWLWNSQNETKADRGVVVSAPRDPAKGTGESCVKGAYADRYAGFWQCVMTAEAARRLALETLKNKQGAA